MSGYTFTYEASAFEPSSVDELKPDFYSHALHAELVIGEDASIDSLVAALRQIMQAAGFSDKQCRQVVVIPHSKVTA
jgi:hypothetical protein